MKIACASKRKPKLDALNDALRLISEQFDFQEWSIDAYSIGSGVSETPKMREEIINGAINRVKTMQEMLIDNTGSADFYVGMEGGFHRININGENITFIEGWAAVSDGSALNIGSSPNLSIPKKLAHYVYEENESLSTAIDRYSGLAEVRDHQGVFGVLTGNILTRELSFKSALITAFAPFYNKEYYENR